MNSIKELFIGYLNEFRKAKKSSAFWLALIAPILIVGIYFLAYFFKTEHFIPKEGVNPWVRLLNDNINNTAVMLLPFFIFLMTALIAQIELRNNMTKQLYILPFDKSALHYAKISFIISLLAMTMIYFVIANIISGYLLGVLRPELKFLEFTPDYLATISITSKLFISSLGLFIIQYWLSMRFKNMIIPLGFGFGMYIASIIFMQGWEKVVYFPYAYSMIAISKGGVPGGENIYIYSLIYFATISVLSYFDLRRKENA